MVMNLQMKNQVAAAQMFITHYNDQGDNFLDCAVTGDGDGYLTEHVRINDNVVTLYTFTTSEKIQNIVNTKRLWLSSSEQNEADSFLFSDSNKSHKCC